MAKQNDEPQIGAFSTNQPIQLVRFPNGGWTVVQRRDPGYEPEQVGAYSTAADMLAALSAALIT